MIWRAIPGFEGIYRINRQGFMHNQVTKVGFYGYVNRKGYVMTTLVKDRVPYPVAVHRVIFEAFVCRIPKGMEINHRNGKRDDNRLRNLECVTRETNLWHMHRYLRNPKQRKRPTP